MQRARWCAVAALILVAMLAITPGYAADGGPSASAPPVTPRAGGTESTTLRFFNRDIMRFRVGHLGLSPAERAAAGAQRIREALAKGGPGTISTVTIPDGIALNIDGMFVFRILEGDVDAEDGETLAQAQVVVISRLQDAVTAARSSRVGRNLLRAATLAATATVALVLLVWGVSKARIRVRGHIDERLARQLHLMREERAAVLRLIRTCGQTLFLLFVAVLVEEWLRFVLGLFPYTEPWAGQLTGYIGSIAATVSGAIVGAVPGLVMVAVIGGLAQLVTKLLTTAARGIEAGRYRIPGIDADVVQPARRLCIAGLWLFALAMAYPYLPGSSSDAFKGLSVLVGLMLSVGASGLVGQAAGGFILTFSRTLRPGDWVRIGEIEGSVVNVGMFATKVRTPIDEEVSIPNSVVLTSVTRNFSRPAEGPASILEASVSVGYNAPWRQVHAMLLEAAAKTPEIEREPPPLVLQTALSDFYVQYSLRARLRNQSRRPGVLSALSANIQDVFTSTACRSCRRTTRSTRRGRWSFRRTGGSSRPRRSPDHVSRP